MKLEGCSAVVRQIFGDVLKSYRSHTHLHPQLLHLLAHLHTMYKRRPASDRDSHVKGFGHLLEVGAFLQAILRVGIDAIGTLHGMRRGERDEAFLACG
jgi:hypothetical protein